MPLQEKARLRACLRKKWERKHYRKLDAYRPYAKQMRFHEAGADNRERLFMAGNQLGKTWAGGFETAMHATGLYPDWWQGRRFDRPTTGWVAGVTMEALQGSAMRILLGRDGDVGSGAVPRDSLVGDLGGSMLRIAHASGGQSLIGFKSYNQGREKWQGETLDWVWFDEEPPLTIYMEGLTRTNAALARGAGLVWMSFTPLLGMSDVVRRFLMTQPEGTHVTSMTIEDAGHYSPEEREAILASYPAHERQVRAYGVPGLGSGRVFPVEERDVGVESFAIPAHWARIGGLDFGWDHPTAAVQLAWDRDVDCIYVTHAYRLREATPVMHAATLKAWGTSLPWAWPHDGLQHSKDSGEPLAAQYRRNGLNMLPERATFEDGGDGVEAGVLEMLERMQTGRLKVFSHLADWWEEFRLYHRKDGRIVKERDDLICATRYAMMMLRFAVTGRADALLKTDTSWVV
ncbi:DNA packaging protein [bacterium]|nr:DNA packaging protein [bacterium]